MYQKSLENELSNQIIGAAIEVHKELGGPGLLEGIYEAALCHELNLRGLKVQRQAALEVKYKDTIIKDPHYIDVIVENSVLIEIKATEKHNPLFETQILTYLRLSGLKLGLLINFGSSVVKNGIHRVINGSL